jgi:hypothetical protein
MTKDIDFSKGERGKFFRTDAKLNLPVYLDDEVLAFVQHIATKQKTDLSSVVNQLLLADKRLVESAR